MAANGANLKQGAYGKVKIHKTSKLEQLSHADEVLAMLCYKIGGVGAGKNYMQDGPPEQQFCDSMLGKVSRSFAGVIRQLPRELQLDICVFYLVLRALDTIEDDMEAFESIDVKVGHLREFHTHLEKEEWTMEDVGEGDERYLLENFTPVLQAYHSLTASSQEVIADITKQMEDGMADFISKDLKQGTADLDEYNLYCHYVAGLVGEGLSRLFAVSALEAKSVGTEMQLADSMGKFLQKTNIIRDYLEDYVDGRAFWPASVWRKHAPNNELGDFAKPENILQARNCLNELVGDALRHIPECLQYLDQIKHPAVFKFCAIPQVMAIATLAHCFDNPDVFTGVCKIRKGLSAKIVLGISDVHSVHSLFLRFTKQLIVKAERAQDESKTADQVLAAANDIHDAITEKSDSQRFDWPAFVSLINYASPVVFLVLCWHLRNRSKQTGTVLPRITDVLDVFALAGVFLTLTFMLSFSGMASLISSDKAKKC